MILYGIAFEVVSVSRLLVIRGLVGVWLYTICVGTPFAIASIEYLVLAFGKEKTVLGI